MTDISDQIESDALKPQSTSVDGVSSTRRSLKDLIEADQYIAAKNATAASNKQTGFRIQQIVPQGGH